MATSFLFAFKWLKTSILPAYNRRWWSHLGNGAIFLPTPFHSEDPLVYQLHICHVQCNLLSHHVSSPDLYTGTMMWYPLAGEHHLSQYTNKYDRWHLTTGRADSYIGQIEMLDWPIFHVPVKTDNMSGSNWSECLFFICCRSWQNPSRFCMVDEKTN